MKPKTRARFIKRSLESGKTEEEVAEALEALKQRDNLKKYKTMDPAPHVRARIRCRRCGSSRPTPKQYDAKTNVARCYRCKAWTVQHSIGSVVQDGDLEDAGTEATEARVGDGDCGTDTTSGGVG